MDTTDASTRAKPTRIDNRIILAVRSMFNFVVSGKCDEAASRSLRPSVQLLVETGRMRQSASGVADVECGRMRPRRAAGVMVAFLLGRCLLRTSLRSLPVVVSAGMNPAETGERGVLTPKFATCYSGRSLML